MAEPITVTVPGPDGPKVYVLQTKLVLLRGGTSLPIYYFVRANSSRALSPGFPAPKAPQAELADGWLIEIIHALVYAQGLSVDAAVMAAASLKQDVCGLNEQQVNELQAQLRRQLIG